MAMRGSRSLYRRVASLRFSVTMDAVEMPLPANIVLPQLLASKRFRGVKPGVEETKSLDFTVQSANVSNYVSFTAAAACLSSTGGK
ncbi:hypothetical protein ACLOJK_010049 [Asimina triloba]